MDSTRFLLLISFPQANHHHLLRMRRLYGFHSFLLLVSFPQANHHHQYTIRLTQNIDTILAIVHWSTFSLGYDNYLVLVSSNLARLYLLSGVSYKHVQDILPSPTITAFRAMVPLAVCILNRLRIDLFAYR